MNNILKKKLLLLTVILFTVSYSCKETANVIYNQNSKLENKDYYIKLFIKHNVEIEKVYFINKQSVNSKFDFLRNLHGNEYYYYYGTVYALDKTLFKTNEGNDFGCKQIIKTLKDEYNYPFLDIPENKEEVLKQYVFINKRNQTFQYNKVKKKTIVFIYNHNFGKVFFKDAKEIISFSENNPDFDYVVLVTDFFNY